jgi:hypothetical protein
VLLEPERLEGARQLTFHLKIAPHHGFSFTFLLGNLNVLLTRKEEKAAMQ